MASSKQRLNRRRRRIGHAQLRGVVTFWQRLDLAEDDQLEPWSIVLRPELRSAIALHVAERAPFSCPLGELVGDPWSGAGSWRDERR